MTSNTLLESAIERKNHYQGRLVDNMVNVIYFTKRKAEVAAKRDKLKVDTEPRAKLNTQIVEIENAIKESKHNITQDELLVASFDDLIKDLSKPKTTEKKGK